jgi:sulfoxide reductase heme-binding subunit YedZ
MQQSDLRKPLQIIVHIGSWIPLAVLVFDFFMHRLTVNPIQGAEIRTGSIAIVLLILSLACTPLFVLTRISAFAKVQRPLGLYAYMYACIHLLIFSGLDYGFDPQLLLQTLVEKPFVIVGVCAFILLTALAVTSFDKWKVLLRKNWKRLHRLVYLINLLVVLHFGWSVKGDFFQLKGDILRPALAAIAVLVLLGMRLPSVRRVLAGKLKLSLEGNKKTAQRDMTG